MLYHRNELYHQISIARRRKSFTAGLDFVARCRKDLPQTSHNFWSGAGHSLGGTRRKVRRKVHRKVHHKERREVSPLSPGRRRLTQIPKKPCMGIKLTVPNMAPWPTEPHTEPSETLHGNQIPVPNLAALTESYTEPSETLHGHCSSNSQPGPMGHGG